MKTKSDELSTTLFLKCLNLKNWEVKEDGQANAVIVRTTPPLTDEQKEMFHRMVSWPYSVEFKSFE